MRGPGALLQESCAIVRPIVMAQSTDLESIYQRGFDLRCSGRYREARTELERVTAVDPKHWKARLQLGLIQGFEGDFDGSLVTLQKLATEFPSNIDILYDLAMTQMMLGYQDEACANFKYILALQPTHSKALQQLVYCP